MFFLRIKWFFERIFFRIKSFFTFDLKYFYLENSLLVFSAIAAGAGVFGFFKEMNWLVIVGAVIAIALRIIQNFMAMIVEDDDFFSMFLNSAVAPLVVAIIAMFPVHFLLDRGFLISLFISINPAVLVFFGLKVLSLPFCRW